MIFNKIKRSTLLIGLLSMVLMVQAQAPAGYYDSTQGRSGASLKTALYQVISNHVARSYKQLWEDFKSTDIRPDGKIWDIYSNITNYVPGRDQAGQYQKEGDVYNREHSFPKSWFNDAHPMYTDLFHLYPSDGYVNGRRSNYPLGETKGGIYKSANEFSKLGSCTTPGYTGTVFEPNDTVKGDLARTYFYMATAYEDRFATFHSPMLANNKYPGYQKWAIDMLLRWAKEDPVDQKEIDRNNAIYKIQKNRNPYIDYPGLEQYVWGDKTNFNPNNYTPGGGGNEGGGGVTPGPDPVTVATPVFSMASGAVAAGTSVSISCSTKGSYIYYTVNGGQLQSGFAPVSYTINANADITAYAMVGEHKSATAKASYTVASAPQPGNNVYTLVSSTDALTTGTTYLIVCEGKHFAMGSYLTKGGKADNSVRCGEGITIENGQITTNVGTENAPYAFTLSASAKGYTFFDAVNKGYLGLNEDKNKLHTLESNTTDNAQWTITIDTKGTHIHNVQYPARQIQYNASSPRFATYTGSQQPVVLYKKAVPSDIEYIETEQGTVDVYTLSGRLIRDNVEADKATEGLPAGIYIVGGVKLIVR